MRILFLALFVCAFAQDIYEVPQSNDLWTYLGTFSMNEPAFLEIVTFDDDASREKYLLIS